MSSKLISDMESELARITRHRDNIKREMDNIRDQLSSLTVRFSYRTRQITALEPALKILKEATP